MRVSQVTGDIYQGHIDVLSLCVKETCSEVDERILAQSILSLPKEFWVTPQDILSGRSPISVFISKKFPRDPAVSYLKDPLREDRKRALRIIFKLMLVIKNYWTMTVINDFEPLILGPVNLVEWVYRRLLAYDHVLFSADTIFVNKGYEALFFELFDLVRLNSIILTVSADQLRPIWSMTKTCFQERLIAKLAAGLAELPEAFWMRSINNIPGVTPRTLFEHLLYDKTGLYSVPEQAILIRVLQCARDKTALIHRINELQRAHKVWDKKLHGAWQSHNFNYQQLFSLKSSIEYLAQNPAIALGLFHTTALRQSCCDYLKIRSRRNTSASLDRLIKIFEEANTVELVSAQLGSAQLGSAGSFQLMAARQAAISRYNPPVSTGSGSDTETDEEWQAAKRRRI
jgi:hypothetical protein